MPKNIEDKKLKQGAGDAFAKAFEMIATPAIFGLFGWFLDSRIGSFPWITLALVLFVFGYQAIKFYSDYKKSMNQALAERRATYKVATQ